MWPFKKRPPKIKSVPREFYFKGVDADEFIKLYDCDDKEKTLRSRINFWRFAEKCHPEISRGSWCTDVSCLFNLKVIEVLKK